MAEKKFKYYEGDSDVQKFVVHVELDAALKGHTDEKKAQYVANRLAGPALEVYLRLSDEERISFEKIKEELFKEFLKGQLDREEAIVILENRRRTSEESAATFSYKIIELVKLAYPSFTDAVRDSIAKDYFVRGLGEEMRISLKSSTGYATMDVKAAASEVIRLELAGVTSRKPKSSLAVNACEENSDTLVEAISEKVLEKLKLKSEMCSESKEVNFVRTDSNYQQFVRRGRGKSYPRGGGDARKKDTRKCWTCGSTQHIMRNCDLKHCQACGTQGCYHRNPKCPNYQS